MWGERGRGRKAHGDPVFIAWASWRQAATRVHTAWEDVSHARRSTRSAAYAEYRQALRKEEEAARDLGARLAAAACRKDRPAIAT